MTQLYRKNEALKEYEKKHESNKMSLYVCPRGTVFDRDLPCVKATYFFEPKFSLEAVIDSVSA